jgi:hypothetical protein
MQRRTRERIPTGGAARSYYFYDALTFSGLRLLVHSQNLLRRVIGEC